MKVQSLHGHDSATANANAHVNGCFRGWREKCMEREGGKTTRPTAERGPGPHLAPGTDARLTSIRHAWKFRKLREENLLFDIVETQKGNAQGQPPKLDGPRPALCRAKPTPIKARLHRIPTVPLHWQSLRHTHHNSGRRFDAVSELLFA